MFEKIKNNWILRNLILAVVVVLGIVTVAQISLSIGTRHNREISVPDFSGLSEADAALMAERYGIRVEVTDSIYNKRLERGAVFSQNPVVGSRVKKDRRIMLTINALVPKTVEMPDLVGYSLRQAKTVILSNGLAVGKLSYVTDIATNNVLGQSIAPGREVETETPVNLTLGCDPENGMTYVPHLTGYTFSVAADNIIDNSLNIGRVRYDETVETYADSLQAVVYRQSPASGGDACPMGTSVNIYLTVNQAKLTASE